MLSIAARLTLDDSFLFETEPSQEHHAEVGSGAGGPDFDAAVAGACLGSVRSVELTGEHADGFLTNVEDKRRGGAVTLTLKVLSVTAAADYAIFSLIVSKDIAGAIDLVKAGIGVNARDQHGLTPLMHAVQPKQQLLIAALLNSARPKVDVNLGRRSGHNPVFYSIQDRDTSTLRALLRRGGDPNIALIGGATAGQTPLHVACAMADEHEHVRHVVLLLDYGADPMAVDAEGRTVLDVAKSAPYSLRKKLADLLNDAVERASAVEATSDEL